MSIEPWKEAMKNKMRTLEKNNVWEMVSLPKGKRTVGCKWIFIIKCRIDGTLEKYKARFVTKGNTQTYGLDYLDIN